MRIDVKFTKLHNDASIPLAGSDKAAGYDIYAYLDSGIESIEIQPHKTVKIGTGISVQPPAGYFGAIFPRSGLATKQGLRPANCVGVCDEDYTGEYIVAIHNDSDSPKTVRHGDRIAQLVFLPYLNVNFVEVSELEETERGDGGFGSTGN